MEKKDRLNELCDKIERGLKISFEKLIAFKKYKNTPLIFSENGEIVEVYAEELEKDRSKTLHPESYKAKHKSHLASEPSESSNKKKLK